MYEVQNQASGVVRLIDPVPNQEKCLQEKCLQDQVASGNLNTCIHQNNPVEAVICLPATRKGVASRAAPTDPAQGCTATCNLNSTLVHGAMQA